MFIHSTGQSKIVLLDKNTLQSTVKFDSHVLEHTWTNCGPPNIFSAPVANFNGLTHSMWTQFGVKSP